MTHVIAEKTMTKREINRHEKRASALDAALTVFSKSGFTAATMDAIAVQAGMTKPTLYQYFESKDALFRAMMLAPRTQMLQAFDHAEDKCHVAQLWEFSWTYAKTVMHPEYLAIARLVIGDAHRNPDLGRHYQAIGPDRVLKGLAVFMTTQADIGRLDIEDAELAAEDFWGLILSAPRNRALHIADTKISKRQLSKYITNGIKVFIKAYSTNPDKDLERLAALMKTSNRRNVNIGHK